MKESMNEAEGEPLFGVATRSLEEGSLALLERYGVKLPWDDPDFPRMDFVELPNEMFDLVRARPKEMPDRVVAGDVTMGVTCTDGLFESESRDEVTLVRELGFGACTMTLMVPEASEISDITDLRGARIATSYPRATAEFFEAAGIDLGMLDKVDGSVEAMPYMPVSKADAIVDLVQSGSSMRANRLRPLTTLGETQAALIENSALACRYDDRFRRFVERIVPIRLEQAYPSDTPERVAELDKKLAPEPEQIRDGSISRELLLGGVEAINRKLGEESFEVLQAFLAEEDDALINEAQTVIWATALGLRARGIELGTVLPFVVFKPDVEQKGNKQNDAIRSLGDAMSLFGNAMLRGNSKEVAEAAARYIGALDNLLALRLLNMAQVYERL